ncbi:MAG: hypothetical protein KIT06_04635, partial [Cryobacterium sp.]|nr:hypothetical protein [Cryobacterium sp.]
ELLVEESVVCVVQVDGKLRERMDVDPNSTAEELEKAALGLPGVVRSVADRKIAKVIVRAPKLVNIVTE